MAAPRMMGPFLVDHTLGKGGFSKVKLGIHNETGEKVALKLLQTNKLSMNESSRKQVEAEITAMSRVRHPNVLSLKHVEWSTQYHKKNGKVQDVMLVVLELAEGGELFEFLQSTGAFEEAVARTYFRQLIQGVNYCHQQNVAHRDLKPENLLLDANFVLKLADFGFAKTMDSSKTMYTQCGTPGYMAPEMFEREGYDPKKADIWACGVILFIMLAGFPPFQQPKINDWWFHKLKLNRHDLFWRAHCRTAYFSDGFKDLINKILCPDPTKRISLEDILKHDWVQGDVIPEGMLHNEMQTRALKINDKKAQERMQKMAKHGGEGVTGMEISAESRALGEDFPMMPPSMDFFVQAMERSNPEAFDGGMEEVSGTAAPYNPVQVSYSRFSSTASPSELYTRALMMIRASGAEYSSKAANFKIKASCMAPTGAVNFTAQVYRDPSKPDTHILEFKRLSGDGLQFRQMYYVLREQMSDLIMESMEELEQKDE